MTHDPFHSQIHGIISTPSPNFTPRKPQMLILHYTAGTTESSLAWMTENNRPSAHYCLTPQGEIHQLVSESQRAWHAGHAYWRGFTDLNSLSIGIELVGQGYQGDHNPRGTDCTQTQKVDGSDLAWFSFHDRQIESLTHLILDIQSRWDIAPHNIIGHSDCAPGRKVDPGPLFPWHTLHKTHGIGAWPHPTQDLSPLSLPSTHNRILWTQCRLRDYGYKIQITGQMNEETHLVLQAFQMHFRPHCISGVLDDETIMILAQLIQRYHYGHSSL